MGNDLVNKSFALFSWITPAWHPLVLPGTLSIYLVQHYFGADQENEQSREKRWRKNGDSKELRDLQIYREEENRFWPSLREAGNLSLWSIIGLGTVLAVAVEAVPRL
ncbi:hypothetical protein N7G274_008291 [Stereocaulon virgatum]|uniref:Uncharacterized protein n=1 Tax=Stereocaulon virgatum TaxID=373712 RepID=A0ABR4A0Y4_9LECA